MSGQITRVDDHTYWVVSQNGNGIYDVISTELGWLCSCPDHVHRGVKCKHIWAVDFSTTFRKEVQKVIRPITSGFCPSCNSKEIVKNEVRHNKYGDIQRYLCKVCGKRFSLNLGFESMRTTPQAITSAMQLYFTGESLRNVQKFLKLQGVNVSHVAIYKWIGKYTKVMQNYLEQIIPKVSDTWRADEIYVKFKGNIKYVFALMDDETRFWIAQEVAESKYAHDARNLFRMGKGLMQKRPKVLITDGLQAYHEAFKKEFWTFKGPRTRHINTIRLQGDMNNNKMERLNGEIRDREKVMRGLKKKDTPILKGYQLYHNYVRPHEALDGKTPAEKAGINIKGQNKWITIIQNANLSSKY